MRGKVLQQKMEEDLEALAELRQEKEDVQREVQAMRDELAERDGRRNCTVM